VGVPRIRHGISHTDHTDLSHSDNFVEEAWDKGVTCPPGDHPASPGKVIGDVALTCWDDRISRRLLGLVPALLAAIPARLRRRRVAAADARTRRPSRLPTSQWHQRHGPPAQVAGEAPARTRGTGGPQARVSGPAGYPTNATRPSRV
jgi:hypothetical protein